MSGWKLSPGGGYVVDEAGFCIGGPQILERIDELERLVTKHKGDAQAWNEAYAEAKRELAEARDFLGQIRDVTDAGKPWVEAVREEDARKLIREINFVARAALGQQGGEGDE